MSVLWSTYTFVIFINVVNDFRSVSVELLRVVAVSELLDVVGLCAVRFCKTFVTADAAVVIMLLVPYTFQSI